MILTLKEAQHAKIAPWTELEYQTEYYSVFRDAYPVTEGHLLFVPTYQAEEFIYECFIAAWEAGQDGILNGQWDGFNVGQNVGETAGQTVMYPHIHMIPRRKGDMEDPRGGVRHVIPEKGNYKNGSKK